MDDHRQAVVSTSLVRLGPATASGLPSLGDVRTIAGVDQSIGGMLAPGEQPSSTGQACRRRPPPPWAR